MAILAAILRPSPLSSLSFVRFDLAMQHYTNITTWAMHEADKGAKLPLSGYIILSEKLPEPILLFYLHYTVVEGFQP